MNRLPLCCTIAVLLLALCWGATAGAAPRYTDKDTALELAQALDKGIFRGKLISSTFIQSVGKDQYFVKVVLENGGEESWDMHALRKWTQDDLLTLSKNRALVFPKEDSSEFGVLDKNQFTQRALRARVYSKLYSGSDVLAGRTIRYSVLNFNLVDLLQVSPGRDEHGYLFRYVLDLENGQREFLSYLEAWEALKRDALQEDFGSAPVLRAPYRLTAIHAQKLKRLVESGVGNFGVEMVFDRPLELQATDFPFRIYEVKHRGATPRLDNPFVIEFTAPNAILAKPIEHVENLEFLYDIRANSDPLHQNRVLLLANLAPEVLTTPPRVEVAKNTVTVTFTKVEDQSVFDRKALQEAELRRRQEKLLAGTLTPAEAERRKLYRQHMETGLGQLDKVRGQKTFDERYKTYQAALANFREAAINASSDQELESALRQRNQLMVRLPGLIIDHVRAGLKQSSVPEPGRLKELLQDALNMTRDPDMLKVIGQLNEQLQKR